MRTQPYLTAIIGNGLAGLSTAYELSRRGAAVVVIGPAEQCSAPPVAVLHPFPGQKPANSLPYKSFFDYSEHRLKALGSAQITAPSSGPRTAQAELYRPLPVVRSLASSAEASLIGGHPVQPTDERFTRISRELKNPHWYETGYAIDSDVYLTALRAECQTMGVQFHPAFALSVALQPPKSDGAMPGGTIASEARVYGEARVYSEAQIHRAPQIHCADGTIFGAVFPLSAIVLATGARLKSWVGWSGMSYNSGSLLHGEVQGRFNCLVSGGGHVAPVPEPARQGDGAGTTRLVLGSTYHHDLQISALPEEFTLLADRSRLLSTLPQLLDLANEADFDPLSLWSGFRSTVPQDKRPVAGAIDEQRQIFIIGGAGSRGYFWLPKLAALLADEIMAEDLSVPAEYQARRIKGFTPLTAKDSLQICPI